MDNQKKSDLNLSVAVRYCAKVRLVFGIFVIPITFVIPSAADAYQKTPSIERIFRTSSVLELIDEVVFSHFGSKRFPIGVHKWPTRACSEQEFRSINDIVDNITYKKFREQCMVARGIYSPTLSWLVANIGNKNCLALAQKVNVIMQKLADKDYIDDKNIFIVRTADGEFNISHVQGAFLMKGKITANCTNAGDLLINSTFRN